ncbi:hypothetical protein NN561_002065 [Cricetulus griseus]
MPVYGPLCCTSYDLDIHTEAVQAALAKHKEQKMALPMPTKRRSTFVQSPADACTPPDTSSASEDEGSLRRQAALSAALQQSLQNAESWINRSIQGSSTSSSASSTLSHGEVKGTSGSLADVFANTRIGVPVNSRVSTKIQQLLSTLKRPKRPPLKEFFVDDSEEIVEVPQPDPNQPKPEGRQMTPVKGEPLGVICNWPPALESALQRWGSTQAKCPCLTGLDVSGKPVYTLTYGSVSSCDAFLSLFQSHGLKPEAICPCATSAEAMTVAIRRPGVPGAPLPGRAILSMNGLSYGVIRVNTEDKNSALTVQDVGHVMPGGMMCIVKPDGLPQLCKTDEIGEICVSSRTGGMMYFGLAGVTKNTFEVIPVASSGSPVGDVPFIRSGLLGFVGPGSLVFVVGKMDGLLMVSGRRHNADDIVATGLAVESIKTVYRGRIAVFSVSVFYDERIVVVAEQRPDASEEDSFQWMSRVLQAIDSIHQVGVYCLALVPANTLPKTPLGGIHISQTKQLFLEGSLHPCNILMCPHTCVTNLPKPRQKQPGVGPASVMVGNLVAGKRIAQAAGRDLGQIEENDLVRKHQFLAEILQWRAQATPDHVLFMLLNAKGTTVCTASCLQLHKRAERIASVLGDKGHLNAGDNVVLLYPPGIELIAAFYGCLYAGCIPVTVRPPHAQNLTATLPTVRMIVDVSKAACILTTQTLMRLLKSREAAAAVDVKTWPTIIDTGERGIIAPELLPFTARGFLESHTNPFAQLLYCNTFHCVLTQRKPDTHVYSGHQSILIPPLELENNLFLWLATVNQYKIRDTFCSYSVMELCTKGLGNQVEVLKTRGINLSCIRTCVVVAEERPRITLQQSFSKLFKDIGLSPRAVSTTFGARVNVAICLQILPGVKVVIVNPETKGPVGDSHLGEIWVNSPHTASGYYTIYDSETLQADHFNTRLSFGDAAQTLWARTGYLGFVRRTELTAATGERHDALYVVGALDETLELRGLRYHPIDIETSVSRVHRSIAECAVFTWTNLLVVVVELCGSEQEALDLVPLVTNVVLEEHYLIVGVVVVVDPGVIPINSRGEKQRMHLRDSFLADQLDPIYVAYNM